MTRALRRVRRSDEGFTLVELIVAMTILVVFFAVFSTMATKVFSTTRKQQNRSVSLDASRNVVQVLDRQVRYANAVNTPVTTADGVQWVEWRAGSRGKQQTCFQYRVLTSGLLQYRTWLPPLTGSGPATGTTAFRTTGSGIGAQGAEPIFALNPATAGSAQSRQQLIVSFQAGKDAGRDGAPTRVAFTAMNSTSPTAPLTPVCQEVPRS